MSPYAEAREFIARHRECGEPQKLASDPSKKGYKMIINCPCGDNFERFVTPRDAKRDMVFTTLLYCPN